jgi:glutathione synthase/RimK-type ligase-like ATP-grasp enzyme
MLIILSNKQDFAADYTILRLEERNVPFLRINSEDIGTMQFTFDVGEGSVIRRIRTATRDVDLRDVTAVWLRRQLQPSMAWIRTEDRAFATTELRHFLDSFLMLHRCNWVNSPESTQLGERKLYVLERAVALGLPVPRTIATNDPISFRERPLSTWVAKPIYQGIHAASGRLQALYTQRLSDFGPIEDEQIKALPCIFQEEVSRGRDLRLTFVGEHGFGASVIANTDTDVDWRRPESKARFEPYPIPASLARWCHLLMSDLGLTYGAFDFIEDRDGRPWFLEVNPAGEFAWLEVQLGLKIRDSLIDAFTGSTS